MSAWTESPRVDVDGRRRPMELTAKLRAAVEAHVPMPKWGLERIDGLMFHLYWPGGVALCGIRSARSRSRSLQSTLSQLLMGFSSRANWAGAGGSAGAQRFIC